MRYKCPCCGQPTLDEEPPGTFGGCLYCLWEDDNVQFNDPDYRGGANDTSLNEAKALLLQGLTCENTPLPSLQSVFDQLDRFDEEEKIENEKQGKH